MQDILDIASRQSPGLGLRTVYRVVNRLLEDKVISMVAMNGQPVRYELAEIAGSHHHHFHCSECDRVYDVHGCPGNLESMLPDGFQLEGHEITLNGVCRHCA